jgi:hypothetical protein
MNGARGSRESRAAAGLESIAADLGRGPRHADLYEAENRLVEDLKSPGPVNAEQNGMLQAADHSAVRLRNLIEDVFMLAKPSAASWSVTVARSNWNPIRMWELWPRSGSPCWRVALHTQRAP